jgi:hypothetical protein
MPYSLFQKGYMAVVLGVIFLVLSILPLYAFLPSTLYWESRPILVNGGSLNQNLGFFVAGTHVELMVYAYGGDERMAVQVMTVGLDEITQEAGVINSGFLAFDPPRNDHYTLHLTNTFSYLSQNNKQILIKVYYYFYNYILLALGIAVVGLGVVLIISNEMKIRARNRLVSRNRETTMNLSSISRVVYHT